MCGRACGHIAYHYRVSDTRRFSMTLRQGLGVAHNQPHTRRQVGWACFWYLIGQLIDRRTSQVEIACIHIFTLEKCSQPGLSGSSGDTCGLFDWHPVNHFSALWFRKAKSQTVATDASVHNMSVCSCYLYLPSQKPKKERGEEQP